MVATPWPITSSLSCATFTTASVPAELRGSVAESISCFFYAADIAFEIFEVLLVPCVELSALRVAECVKVGDLRFEASGISGCEALCSLGSYCSFAYSGITEVSQDVLEVELDGQDAWAGGDTFFNSFLLLELPLSSCRID